MKPSLSPWIIYLIFIRLPYYSRTECILTSGLTRSRRSWRATICTIWSTSESPDRDTGASSELESDSTCDCCLSGLPCPPTRPGAPCRCHAPLFFHYKIINLIIRSPGFEVEGLGFEPPCGISQGQTNNNLRWNQFPTRLKRLYLHQKIRKPSL